MRVEAPWGTIELGTVEAAPTIGITDYSRRVTDAYGTTIVVERGFSRRMSVRLAIASDVIDAVQDQLARLRATVATWTADDRFASLSVQGFVKDFAIDIPGAAVSFCTLTIEGVVEPIAPADGSGDPAPGGEASTLRLIQPVTIGDAQLVASNVIEADHGEWNAGGTYGAGNRVILTSTHRIYESAIGGNIGNDPAGTSGKWFDVGPTNRWAMFDQALGTVTSAPGAIEVTVNAGAADAIALLDIAGGSTARVVAAGYDRTVSAEGGIATFFDLPGGQVTVTIAGPGTVAAGTMLVGRLVALGITEAGAGAGITDYSRKVVDEFGEVTLVERAYAKRMTAKALIRTDALDLVAARIATVRARPALWIGQSGSGALTILGFFKDFSIEVGGTVSKLSLSIEGLSKATPLADPNAPLNDLRDRLDELRADIDAIASDGVLTHGREKGRLIRDYVVLTNGLAALNARFVALTSPADLVTVRDIANARRVDLDTLLLGYVPAWNDLTTDTPIDGEQLRATWATAAQAISTFAAAITGRPGAGAVTLVANTPTTIVSASTVRGTAATGWGSDAAYSQEVYGGGAVASFTLPPIHGDNVMVGLTQGSGTDRGNGYESITFALHRNDQGMTQAFVNGAGHGAPGPVVAGAMAGRVHFDGRVVRWFVNEVKIAEYNWLGPNDDPYAPGVLLRFRATLASTDPRVENITFLPAGGAGRDGEDGEDGTSAPLVLTQWSIDGVSGWHDNFFGADVFQRQSNDNGLTWGPAYRVIGEAGAIGADGTSPSIVFKRSATVPATPANNSGNPPAEWSDAPPEGTDFLWQSKATFRGATQLTAWSAPVRISGKDGADAPLVRTQWSINGVDGWHDNFFGADLYQRQSNDNGATWGPAYRVIGEAGAIGADGTSPSIVFLRSATVPAAPADNTGNPPAGWSDGPPAGTDFLWQSKATFRGATQLTSWSAPVRISGKDGADAPLIRTQWSINGVDGWHDNFFGADVYQRQSNDNGATWGPAYRAIGEAGTIGTDGSSPSIVFLRSATVPGTPANNSGNPPTGWSDGPSAGTDFLWQSKATFRGATQLTGWSAPVRISGKDGADALSTSATPATHTVSCDFGGNPKSGESSKTSTITVVAGTTNVTGAATIAITSTGGCGASMSGATLTLSAFSADSGFAELTISYGGASTLVRITFSKARDGAPGNAVSAQLSVSSNGAWTDSSAILSLAVQGAGTVTASAAWRSGIPTSSVTGGVRILYRVAGTTTWSVLDEQTTAVPAQEPFDVAANGSFTTSAAAVYEFIAQTARSGNHGAIRAGNLNVSWQP